FKVVRQGTPGEFSSKLVAERAFPKGSVIAELKGLTPGEKRYSSVQVSENEHIELNSDLLYMNHSCDPSAIMDVDRMAVTANKDIAPGDELTFFYPSTEWDMAQPFSCWCGSSKCIKTVQGAQYLSTQVLNQFHLSKHITEL
ncbi:SET domain-containing protein, partial [Rhizopus microsporus ATCC 52813]